VSDIPSRMCQDLLDLHEKKTKESSEDQVNIQLHYTLDDDGNKHYDWDEIAIGVEESISHQLGIYVCVGMRALDED